MEFGIGCCCGGQCNESNCSPFGSVVIDGMATWSVWLIQLPKCVFAQEHGSIYLPLIRGGLSVTYSEAAGGWVLNISSLLRAVYSSGDDATSVTELSGDLTLRIGSADATITLCVTGTVPPQE